MDTVKGRHKSGQPGTVATAETKERLNKKTEKNSMRSVKNLAGQFGISEFSVQMILKRNAGHRSFKHQSVHNLLGDLKRKRVQRNKLP